jgi:hypothetical protein
MVDQDPTWTVGAGIVADPTLGHGKLFKMGTIFWATFQPAFRPLGDRVSVLVDVLDGRVPSSTVGLYREIEAHYSKLLPDIVRVVCSRISTPMEAVEQGFKLEAIDLRGDLRPSVCVLHYHADRAEFEFDWYARVSPDYRIEFCGERD